MATDLEFLIVAKAGLWSECWWVDILHVYNIIHDNIVNLLYVCEYVCVRVYVHINHAGRLLRKTEYQYSDFYIQLAAHFLLEVYQETGTVYCYTILCTVWSCLFTDNISFLWDTAIMLELGWKRSRSNAQIQLMLLKIYGELGEFFCVNNNQ